MQIENIKTDGFCWVHPDVRISEEELKEFLEKNPESSVNIGDGTGCWIVKGKNKPKKINTPKSPVKEVKKVSRKKTQGSSIVLLPSSGMTWEEKKIMIEEKITDKFGEIPEGVTFKKLNMKSGSCETNPDGMRLLVNIEGLRRQRLYDYKGRFKLNRIYKEIESLKDRIWVKIFGRN